MLWSEKGINWNNCTPDEKRGTGCFKTTLLSHIEDPRKPGEYLDVERRRWIIDHDTPIFTKDREYIERLIR